MQQIALSRLMVITLAGVFPAALPAVATSILPQLPPDAELPASSTYMNQDWLKYYFNTDDGKLYSQYSNYPWDDTGAPAGTLVAQEGGPSIRVWDFSTFDVPANFNVWILGSAPAAIRAQGNITIAGTITVTAGGQPGGEGGSHTGSPSAHGAAGTGANGGGGGLGTGGLHLDSTGFADTAHAGAGGGGGFASPGQRGHDGKTVLQHHWDGNLNAWVPDPPAVVHLGGEEGAAYTSWTILIGGGGGGGGGAGIRYGGGHSGGKGGDGGGAVLFVTPGDLTIAATGIIRADGQNASYFDGGDADSSGGGGAGGYIAFDVVGIWTNHGTVSAHGGAGWWGGPRDYTYQVGGAGSGGYIAIDPAKIINDGVIDVAGGDATSENEIGGRVLLSASSIVNTGQITGSADTTTVPPSGLSNVSIRSSAGTGDNTLIVGFIVAGGSAKQVLIRGIGPSLSEFGVSAPLENPVLSLYSGGSMVDSNDDWGGAASLRDACTAVGAFDLLSNSADAVLLASVGTGNYTAHLTSASGSGIALVETYDADLPSSAARLINVSARTNVGAGENVLIVGFVISGTPPKTVLVRGIGPTLATFAVAGSLEDPVLEIYRGSSKLYENDNWGGDAALIEAFTATGAFELAADSKDAALVVALPPGAYTAQVKGVNAASGVALVEVYEVP